MSTGRTGASLNRTLTNYAFGLAQDKASALAEFIAPTVPTGVSIGQYKKFNRKNAFAVYETARALGGPATRIKFEASDPTFNCKPQALEIALDDAERDASGDADPLGMEQAKVETLVINSVTSHEDKVMAAIAAGATAVAGKGNWTSSSNDPVAEMDAQIKAIIIATGMMPNRMVMGIGAWEIARNHPSVVARQPGSPLIGLTTSQFAAMLLNPGIEIKLGILSKDTAKWGNTKNNANIVGDNVYIFHGSQAPTLYDPSFAKTFMVKQGGATAVHEYRANEARSDIYALDWSEDVEVVSTSCVKRLTIT